VVQTDGRTRTDGQNSWARTRGAQLSAGYTVNTYSKPPQRLRFSWQHKSAPALILTLTLSAPWMQAYLGTIVCKFGGDPVIACERAGNYSAGRRGQTDTTITTSHISRTQLKAGNWSSKRWHYGCTKVHRKPKLYRVIIWIQALFLTDMHEFTQHLQFQ